MAQIIADHSTKALILAKQFREKWAPILAKHLSMFQSIVNELINEPLESSRNESMECDNTAPPELSVHAQYILEECFLRIKTMLSEMLQEHRQVHPPISKCGKDLDRYFQSDLNHLMKNEKNIESNPEHLQKANRLIFEHLVSLGRIDVAETFMKESEHDFDIPSNYDMDLVKQIMEPFRQRNFKPAIDWVEQNAPENEDLLFRLHSQHILQLLENENKKDALVYGRVLQPFSNKYKDQIAQLMFIVVSYDAIKSNEQKGIWKPYEHLFHEGSWLALEEDLAMAISDFRCPLATILNVGAKAIPSLLTLRSFLRRTSTNYDQILHIDELPCDVAVPQRVHSTFSCPILKTQSTESNPPMRLTCGHVISSDALNKLAAQSRNQRLKCPYCPEESNVQDAIQVYF